MDNAIQVLAEHWHAGGLVTCNMQIDNPWTLESARDCSLRDLRQLVTPGNQAHNVWQSWLDVLAGRLARLQDAGAGSGWRGGTWGSIGVVSRKEGIMAFENSKLLIWRDAHDSDSYHLGSCGNNHISHWTNIFCDCLGHMFGDEFYEWAKDHITTEPVEVELSIVVGDQEFRK